MSEELLLLIVAVLSSAVALGLSLFNLRHLEPSFKLAAGITADALRLAEPFVPLLRNSRLDNYIRDVLRSYAVSDPSFVQSLNAVGETVDHVADVLPVLDPGLHTLGCALASDPEQCRSLMAAIVQRVKDYDEAVHRIQSDLQRLV